MTQSILGTINPLDNAITSSLGLDVALNSRSLTPNSFHTRFASVSQFDPGFLTNTIRAYGNFDVTILFRPTHSKVRWLLSQALNASDANPDFGFYIRKISPPNFKLDGEAVGMTGYQAIIPKASDGQPNVELSRKQFTIELLSTEYSLAHHVFYYWMKEAAAPVWSYLKKPSNSNSGWGSVVNNVMSSVNSVVDKVSSLFGGDQTSNDEQNNTDLATCFPFTKADIYIKHVGGEVGDELETLVLEDCYPYQIHNYEVDHNTMFKESIAVDMHCANAYIKSPFYGKNFQGDLTSSIAGQILEENVAKYIKRAWGNWTDKVGQKITDKINSVQESLDFLRK